MKQEDFLFNKEEREFLQFLVKSERICLFKQAQSANKDKVFEYKEDRLVQLIKDANYVRSKHIRNIISESAKLSIRDYMDKLAVDSEAKIEQMCRDIIREISAQEYNKFTAELSDAMKFKESIMNLVDKIKNAEDK